VKQKQAPAIGSIIYMALVFTKSTITAFAKKLEKLLKKNGE
jgi:hypothetical protein